MRLLRYSITRLNLLVVIFIAANGVFSQTIAEARGLEIISSARKAIYGDNVPNDESGIRVTIYKRNVKKSTRFSDRLTLIVNSRTYSEEIYSMGSEGRVKVTELSESIIGDNTWMSFNLRSLNGSKFSQRSGDIERGKFVPDDLDGSEDTIKSVRSGIEARLTTSVFPVTLLTPDAKYAYQGIAESPEGRAKVVKVTYGGESVDFFFDEKTHLLLMTKQLFELDFPDNSYDFGKEVKYFSDHRLIAGVMIPTKVKREYESQMFSMIDGKKMVSNSARVFEESMVSIEINPKFSDEEFTSKFDPKELEKKRKSLQERWNEK